MDLRLIVPVKPFAEAKQRLSPVLNPVQRAELAERMFRHVLRVTTSCFGAANVLVVSRSDHVLAMARSQGAVTVQEKSPSNLNAALSQALRTSGALNVLVVASDLPFLAAGDLAAMAEQACAIAPDRRHRGTNALLWPVQLPFAFGDDSFARHRAAAEGAGLVPTPIVRRGLAHDVDLPDDLNGLEF